MTRTALRRSGIRPEDADVPARAEEFSAMVGAAGSLGPAYLRARLLRARSERWAQRVILRARRVETVDGGVVGRLAFHTDADASRMPAEVAAVELINILRPIVAVGRYIVFAAHALHLHPDAVPSGARDEDTLNGAIAGEVRRLYPFFPMIGGVVRDPSTGTTRISPRATGCCSTCSASTGTPTSFARPATWPMTSAPRCWSRKGGGGYLRNHRCPGEWLTVAQMTEAIGRLRDIDWEVPEQDPSLPVNQFPPWPRDGMRLCVPRAMPRRPALTGGPAPCLTSIWLSRSSPAASPRPR